MVARRVSDDEVSGTRRPAAMSPEARENQLISGAVELAEKQIREGSASAQVITHYLKLGSTREKLEQQRLANENALTLAKIESIGSAQRTEELMKEAITAFRQYSGQAPPDSAGDYGA